jgi:hypothetical protein
MSISNRVASCFREFVAGRFEDALLQSGIAMGAAARLEHPQPMTDTDASYRFISDSHAIISEIGIGVHVGRFLFDPDLMPEAKRAADGTVGLEDILYRVLRCTQVHQATLHEHIVLSPAFIVGMDPPTRRFVLPSTISIGMAIAAVVSPACANEDHLRDGEGIQFGGRRVLVNELWGQREAVITAILTIG